MPKFLSHIFSDAPSNRLPLHQLAFDLDLAGAGFEAAGGVDDEFGGQFAHFIVRQHQGGERRAGELRDLAIVEADDGDIAGDGFAEFAQRVVTPDRHHVVGAEDGVGRIVERHQFARHLVTR